MYGSAFCRAYNEFGWNVYPEVFAGQLLRFLEQRRAAVRSALDLGCGTGILCRELIRSGIRAVGVDLSEGMIDIARAQVPEGTFFAADMAAFRPEERFDLATCTGDALNHLFDPEDIRRVFENAAEYLVPGGLLVFDLLRESEVPPDEPFEMIYSDSVRAVFRTAREPGGVIRLHIELFENDTLTAREDIMEKLYDPALVCAMLSDAGFRVLQCADRLLLDADTHGSTWFIAAENGRTE